MTIPVKKLVEGQWYDGFLFNKGKQSSVTTMMWSEGRFSPGNLPHSDDAHTRTWGWSFEPNVRGVDPNVKEPAVKNPRATAQGYEGSGRTKRGSSPLSGDGTLGAKAPVKANRSS